VHITRLLLNLTSYLLFASGE